MRTPYCKRSSEKPNPKTEKALKKRGSSEKLAVRTEVIQKDTASEELVKEKRGKPARKPIKHESNCKAVAEEILASNILPGKYTYTGECASWLWLPSCRYPKFPRKKKRKISHETATHRVYINLSGVIFDATLKQIEVGKNSRFYNVQVGLCLTFG